MFSFLKNGHAASCGVPELACTCPRLYVLVGLLGMVTGALQIVVGYTLGGGLSLTSDGTHSGADGASDFLVAIITAWVLRSPHFAETLEIAGRKIIALTLAASAVWIVSEALERAASGMHTAIPLVLAVGGVGGVCVDSWRLHLLKKARSVAPSGMLAGLIAHAQGDRYRSIIAAGIGSALVAGNLATAAPWYETTILYVDLTSATGLSFWMFFVAKGIWRGEHVHTADVQHGSCGHDHHH